MPIRGIWVFVNDVLLAQKNKTGNMSLACYLPIKIRLG